MMMASDFEQPLSLAKIVWKDPQTGQTREFVLMEGATATIGRLDDNDICIKEQHVSRQHAIISYRDGIFTLTDLGSANGTFVNDRKLAEAFPLASGDEIRLYVPRLLFSATVSAEDQKQAEELGTLILPTSGLGKTKLVISNGPQEGETLPLLLSKITIGRATSNADWEVCLQDPSVSRPHARLERGEDRTWVLYDLGSANGTTVNGAPVQDKGRSLRDGDVLTMGATIMVFRT